MSVQNFFVMAKPDAVERGLVGKIISRFEKKGFKLKAMRYLYPSQTADIIPIHYEEHKGKSFYNDLISFSLSGQVCCMIWEGNIMVARTMVGATLPWEAPSGTIRGDYGNSLPRNLIHCSDSLANAEREIKLWFELL